MESRIIELEKRVAALELDLELNKKMPDQPKFVPCDSDHPNGINSGIICANS